MIERSVYVRDDSLGDDRIGMVTVIEDGGRFGIGWSLYNRKDGVKSTDNDKVVKFSKTEAKAISFKRAVQDYADNTRWFKDIQHVTSFEELGIKLPKVKCADNGWNFWMNGKDRSKCLHDLFNYSLINCIKEVIYTCALTYLRQETIDRPER